MPLRARGIFEGGNQMADSPLIVIRVSSPAVDEITVYREIDCGWKIDGTKDGQSVWDLDQLQDDFSSVIRVLADHVDDTSIWILSPEMRQVSPWHALTVLTENGSSGGPTLVGSC